MNIVYQSVKFDNANIVSRYVRKYSNGEVMFFDVNAKHKTIREYWMHQNDCDDFIKSLPASSDMVKI